MKIFLRILLVIFISIGLTAITYADEMTTVRSDRDFDETMNALQNAIVQRKGYKTDKYRIVFYGKADEIAALAKNYPQIIPFLPLSVAIFSEGNQTILTTMRPRSFRELFPDAALQNTFEHWDNDLISILEEVRLSH
jgi:uncharacterized protein (DUF302 family)